MRIRWSTSNRKLAKLGTISFGIPAGVSADGFDTCPAKGACFGWCYARRGFYKFPWVQAAKEANLTRVRGDLDLFGANVVDDLLAKASKRNARKLKDMTVRVHDDGDFFSLEYLRTWYRIARYFPEVTFYSYTKMFDRLSPAIWNERPANFQMIQSMGGVDDDKLNQAHPICRVFVTEKELKEAGYTDASENDLPAIRGDRRIGIVFHSDNAPLSEAQVRGLRVIQ